MIKFRNHKYSILFGIDDIDMDNEENEEQQEISDMEKLYDDVKKSSDDFKRTLNEYVSSYNENIKIYSEILTKYRDKILDKTLDDKYIYLSSINKIIDNISKILKIFSSVSFEELHDKIKDTTNISDIKISDFFSKEGQELFKKIGIDINEDTINTELKVVSEKPKQSTFKHLDYSIKNFNIVFKNINNISKSFTDTDVIDEIKKIYEKDKDQNLSFILEKFLLIYKLMLNNVIYYKRTFIQLLIGLNKDLQEGDV